VEHATRHRVHPRRGSSPGTVTDAAVARSIAAAAPGAFWSAARDPTGPRGRCACDDRRRRTHTALAPTLAARPTRRGPDQLCDPAMDRSRPSRSGPRRGSACRTRKISLADTPGVARVASIWPSTERARCLTGRNNAVAVVTDGSAVLGLGNLGPTRGPTGDGRQGALFAHLAESTPSDLPRPPRRRGIVAAVTAIAPASAASTSRTSPHRLLRRGGPACGKPSPPVLHDDQHGTP